MHCRDAMPCVSAVLRLPIRRRAQRVSTGFVFGGFYCETRGIASLRMISAFDKLNTFVTVINALGNKSIFNFQQRFILFLKK